MSQRSTNERIEQIVKSYHDRGAVTRRAFCQAHGISNSTLDYYLRRHRERKPQQAGFVEFHVQQEQRGGVFALILANGRRIECGHAELAQMIRSAESC